MKTYALTESQVLRLVDDIHGIDGVLQAVLEEEDVYCWEDLHPETQLELITKFIFAIKANEDPMTFPSDDYMLGYDHGWTDRGQSES